MMALDSALYRELDAIISEEIQAHRDYLTIIEQERALIVASKSAELAEITAVREKHVERMRAGQEKRFSFIRQVRGEPEMLGRRKAPPPQITLGDFVKQNCLPAQQRILLPKIKQLREVAQHSLNKSREFGQIVSFSLQMVSGLLSILWSATKNVVRAYTPAGSIKESIHDGNSRKAGVLKEA